MISQGVLSLFLSATLLPPAPPPPSASAERPLAFALATQAQAMDARLQVRPAAQTDPAASPAKQRMSRGKKIGIALGIVAGVALIVVALDDDDDDGSGGGGY